MSGQYGDVSRGVVGQDAGVEPLCRNLCPRRIADADVQFFAVVFSDGCRGGFPRFRRQVVPVLDDDDVVQLFFAAGFEQGFVSFGRGNGND